MTDPKTPPTSAASAAASTPPAASPKREAAHARPPGLGLFLFYLVLYAGFIAGNVLRPDMMAFRIKDTISVAVAYGMLLIITAALLALLYVLRTPKAEK